MPPKPDDPPGSEGTGLSTVEPLFRREAYLAGDGAFGRPVAHLPVSWRILAALLMAMVGSAFVLLVTNSYERKETAHGILRSLAGDAQVMAPDRGIIRTVEIAEGDLVRAGQTLFTVSTERAEAAGRLPQADMLTSLAVQEASLRQRLTAMRSNDVLEDSVAVSQLDDLRAAQEAAKANLTAAREQFTITQDDYRRALPIAQRGFISQSDIRRREQALIASRQAVAGAIGQVARLQAQVAEQRFTAAKRPYASVKDRGLIEDQLAEIQQRRAQYVMSRGFAIRAPVAGRATTLQASIGQLADPARPLMAIVPPNAPLVAVLYVPSRGAGFLHPGQRVRLRYDAYPYQTFGAAGATVKAVSQTVLRPEDVDAAVHLEEPSYRLTATLDRQDVNAFGNMHRLHPGMALTADIVLEKRSIAAWLFEPLLAMKGRL